MSFTTKYLKSYTDIGTKIILKLNSFCLQNNVMLENDENACDRAYSVNFLDDFELLDLESAFNPRPLLGNCALIKNNMLSIFMLSGSIQFSLYFSLSQIMQFYMTMLSYFLK